MISTGTNEISALAPLALNNLLTFFDMENLNVS
jgi:hypothetical protein